jgi:hypothetical protein
MTPDALRTTEQPPMTTKLTISLAQMDCRLGDPETNFAHAAR